MRLSALAFTVIGLATLSACSPVKTTATNQYKLDAYSSKVYSTKATRRSVLITVPEASGGYENNDMLYVQKPYELNSFVHNAWVTAPANMLSALMLQSLQRSGLFYAVATGPNSDHTDYRLDTLLLELQQNFLTKPSTLEFSAKVVLTHVSDNRVIASKIFRQSVKCPQNTPYGGVIAANQATTRFTADLTEFVNAGISRDQN